MPDAVESVWPKTVVETCVVRLLRNLFCCAARQDRDKNAELLRPLCTAPTEEAALERFAEFAGVCGRRYPVVVRLWENPLERVSPFVRFRYRDPPHRLHH
ncbi:transposase [Streptomyces sp. 3211]|uniref:transposase n=1 Tax=Streptomyces sp. 3211 TaxID=1964449 RepID=UPI00161F58CF|nr:transposase [Streptomyces sp. 3211]